MATSQMKSIKELYEENYRFIVPSYQRVYRWSKRQVNNLISDLYSYNFNNNAKYCLQPVILKKFLTSISILIAMK